jgi:hypothetical protein
MHWVEIARRQAARLQTREIAKVEAHNARTMSGACLKLRIVSHAIQTGATNAEGCGALLT